MNQRFAAIDLGSNTFHILIAEKNDEGGFDKIHKQRVYVYLGRDGVEHINQESYDKGLETLAIFSNLMKAHKVSDYRMTGTATLRNADNGLQFLQDVKEQFDLTIEIIDGLQEADLIYKGVRAFLPPPYGKYLIMDIGGGSVEFIYFDQEKMHYSESFPIGISVMFNKFQKSDPLGVEELILARAYVQDTIKNLSHFLKDKTVDALIGSAGSFEIIAGIFKERFKQEIPTSFSNEQFDQIFHEIIPLNKEQRLVYPGIPEERVVLMPIAMVLIDQLLKMFEIKKIIVSPYALKEGIISDFIS